MLIAGVFPDGYAAEDADEAIQVWNVGGVTVDVGGWTVSDGEGTATFPAGARLAAGARWWVGRDGVAFAHSFGQPLDWSWSRLVGSVPRLATLNGGPVLANTGDAVVLRDAGGSVVDAAAYGSGSGAPGWVGPAIRPYRPGGIGVAHQVLYRKLDPAGGGPGPDTDQAGDWASDPADPVLGRRIRLPGWDLEENLQPLRVQQAATIEVAVAPDALLDWLRRHLGAAQESIDLLTYTFDNPVLADLIAERAAAGVRVRVLLDGAPAGGIEPNERWCLHRIAAAGGQVYWFDDGGEVRARYRSAHAKLAIVDGRWLMLGSENFSLGAAPADDRSDGTAGRRGVFVGTDAPGAVAWARDLLGRDLDPDHHVDLRPFQARDPERGAPAPDFEPERPGGGTGYAPIAPAPLAVRGEVTIELLAAPENVLHPSGGLLGLLDRAGSGDEILVEQMVERPWWGTPAEGDVALNPRLGAYLAGARRGARVRVLLDAYFDDHDHWNANAVAVRLLNTAARVEDLDLEARLGNPTGRGIHNKMVLVALADRSPMGLPATWWSHLGSLNGSETSHKLNREAAVQVESAAVHDYLARVFAWDWEHSPAATVWVPWGGRWDGGG